MPNPTFELDGREYVIGLEWIVSESDKDKAPKHSKALGFIRSISDSADWWVSFRANGPAAYHQIGVITDVEMKPKGGCRAAAACLAHARPESASYAMQLDEDLWWGVVISSGLIVASTDATSGDGGDIWASSREELEHRMPLTSLDASADHHTYETIEETFDFLGGVMFEAGKVGRVRSIRNGRRNFRLVMAASVAATLAAGALSVHKYEQHRRAVAREEERMALARKRAANQHIREKIVHRKDIAAFDKKKAADIREVTRPWKVHYKPDVLLQYCRQSFDRTFVGAYSGWLETNWKCQPNGAHVVWQVMQGATLLTAPKGDLSRDYITVLSHYRLPGDPSKVRHGWRRLAKLSAEKSNWVVYSQYGQGRLFQIGFSEITDHVMKWPKSLRTEAKKLRQKLPTNKVLWHQMGVTVTMTVAPWLYPGLWHQDGFVISSVQYTRGSEWKVRGVQYGY